MLLEEMDIDPPAGIPRQARPQVHSPAVARYVSDMHGERTQVEVFSRVPGFSFETLPLGPMALLSMHCGTVSIRRDPDDVRARSRRMMTFIHQVHGRSRFRHYGHEIVLADGDFALCDNGAPYDLRIDGPNDILLFRVPGAMVSARFPSPDMLCGRRLRGDEGLLPLAAAMARALASGQPGALAGDAAESAGRHLLDVLASACQTLSEAQGPGTAVMTARFWSVKRFIEAHLREPALGPAFIARQLRLSDRYLRMIFALSDEAPSAYILRRRLEECAAQLRDPRWRHHSITSIAFGWGFNSAPHFARRFRARFQCAPRDYRRQMLARDGATPRDPPRRVAPGPAATDPCDFPNEQAGGRRPCNLARPGGNSLSR